ncbi:Uncharacterized protein BP5553_06709 [Venustampulla echinocandica]|uniref:Rhodopsin domain-containing protein n=1 Tax=Venustampulla echinocandica TaxID=2656787 RepID=A0A370TKS3_9HELO|nr:Uncharacterized protein BP5553_06709 [Venustampulla echinocandica]RDL36097.1 Uncharacterized protein BP5553_06709 [Venustampulla echinocandica]
MSATNFTAPPQPLDSPENHGPLINVMTWFLVVASTLTVLTRIATKWLVSKRVQLDDGLVFVSLLFSIGQTVAVGVGVLNGIGRHIETLSTKETLVFQKAFYAANLLWLASQCFSKLSVVMFIRAISPGTFNERATLAGIGITALWGFTSIITVAFQCHLPNSWETIQNTCFDRKAFWNYTNSINIAIDLLLVLMPLAMVWKLQLAKKRKVMIVSCFGTRVATIAAVVCQMVATNKSINSPDASFDIWLIQIAMAIAQCLGIVTACVPYLKPFMDALESGMIRSDDLFRRGDMGGSRTNGYGYSRDRKSPLHSSNSKSVLKSSTSSHITPTTHELGPMKQPETINSITVGNQRGHQRDWEAGSDSSRTKIITQTRSWLVSSENEGHGTSETPTL